MGWRRFFLRDQWDRERANELQSYLDHETAENLARGMTPEDAELAARRKLGSLARVREEIYRANTVEVLETVWHDVRYAIRSLRKNGVFAVTAILTLALGIGVTTSMFTVIHGVLLKPLPYHDPDRIVEVFTGTIVRYEELKVSARSFVEIGAFADRAGDITLSGEGEPEVVKLAAVSANFLHILGIEPLKGRSFLPEEEAVAGSPVAMISAELWERKFGNDASITSKNVTLAGGPATIIGVLPRSFQFPFPDVGVWVTKPTQGISPTSPGLVAFARLKPEVSRDEASAELTVLTRQYALAHPGMLDAKPSTVGRVRLLKEGLVVAVRPMLWMLSGAVTLVLLIACANVASLLLSRSHGRSREFAVRAAIGAPRRRILRQLLVESVLLACAGGAVGVILGSLGLSAMTRSGLLNLPRTPDIRLDGTVLAFATALSIVTGVLFGLIPLLGVSTPDLVRALKSSGEGRHARRSRARSILLGAQVALSVILLIGATLLMQSMVRLYRVDLYFNPENVLTMQMSLPLVRYDTPLKRVAFLDSLIERIEAQEGVQSVGLSWTIPFTDWVGSPVQPVDQPLKPLNERSIAVINSVNSGYFTSLQIPLRLGRFFEERDDLKAPAVVMINETFARHYWPRYPAENPVGRQVLVGANPKPAEIIGIVADIRLYADTDVRPAVYKFYRQGPAPTAAFSIRTNGDPMRFVAGVRERVRTVDRDQAVSAMRAMETLFGNSLGQRRLVLILLEIFAGAAFVLAIVGTYGLIAYAVAQRTREVGVRLALGARPSDIVRTLVSQSFFATIAGIAVGLGGAFGLTRFLKSYLFEVSPTEATTFVLVAMTFIFIAAASTFIPLRRATRIDPMTVLRHE